MSLTENDLHQFTGTTQWFRHSLVRSITYTDGVQYLAEKGGAYWLLDKVATNQMLPEVRAEPFQTWKLVVRDQGFADLTATDGNERIIYSERIEFTDFPLPQIELWFENGVILLPSEH